MAGLLSDILGLIDRAKQSAKANIGLLVSDPREYFMSMEDQARENNRLGALAIQAERNAARGLPVTPEQAAAKQYVDNKTAEIALGFAGTTKVGKTPFELAHETAQKNAITMLGLPPNNTAMDRARAMNFDISRYHGTKGDPAGNGIQAFDMRLANDGLYGSGVYSTSSPQIAGGGAKNTVAPQGYATNEALNTLMQREAATRGELQQVMQTLNKAKAEGDSAKIAMFEKWANDLQSDLANLSKEQTGGGAVYPLMVRNENPFNPDRMRIKRSELPKQTVNQIEDWMHSQGKNPKGKWPLSYEMFSSSMGGNDAANKALRELGYTGIQHKGGAVTGVPIKHTVDVAFDPSQVRSRFAAFDPARINENDLLAAGVPLGLIASTEVDIPKKKKKDK